jgi:hypothetical protein
MMIIIIMALQSQEKINNYIITFQLQKITYNGTEGFFIPFTGYQQLLLLLNDYVYYQELVIIKDNRIKELQNLELLNYKLKTGLGISISFNIGVSLLAISLGILTYNLAKLN